jgi:hypothetical protein
MRCSLADGCCSPLFYEPSLLDLISAERVGPSLRTPHTHFKRGTPLRIILRDGRKIYDQFEGHGSGHIVLREYGKLQLRSVKAVTIWKGKQIT